MSDSEEPREYFKRQGSLRGLIDKMTVPKKASVELDRKRLLVARESGAGRPEEGLRSMIGSIVEPDYPGISAEFCRFGRTAAMKL